MMEKMLSLPIRSKKRRTTTGTSKMSLSLKFSKMHRVLRKVNKNQINKGTKMMTVAKNRDRDLTSNQVTTKR
jgi:hypothetical protein